MGYASKNQGLLSKIATSDGHGEASPYFDGWKAYDNNPFHLSSNPEGVIQMGLAENQLCFDVIEEWLMKNPTASICNAEGVAMFKDIANFQDYHGLPAFRKAVANFMERSRGGKAKFDPDRVVMSGGATGATETIAFCLANPDDAFLVPSPYYPAFDRDLRWRTGVQLLPVTCYSSNNFKITKEALEAAYAKAQEDNINVKGVLVNNPSNPLGTVLDRTTLQSIVSFVNEKNIHLVCDEIYAATVFNQPDFVSVAEIVEEDSSCNQELIHITYSLSKDMGLPGFRVGIVYSYNDAVVACARKMSSFGLVSSQTQYLISSMLSDNEFIDRFIIESSKRLATRHKAFTRGLAQVGIGCLESNAGLFFWMDLRHLLKESSVEAEMELWHVIIDEVKLNISPGSSFHCSEPGWFRVCFANMDNETMDVALNRIWSFVLKAKEAEVPVKPVKPVKSNRWQKNLRLSFKAPRFDEIGMNSDTMSPHSPLVTART